MQKNFKLITPIPIKIPDQFLELNAEFKKLNKDFKDHKVWEDEPPEYFMKLNLDCEPLQLTHPQKEKEKVTVENCNDWKKYKDAGYYPYDTYSINTDGIFGYIYSTIQYMKEAKEAELSFFENPKCGVVDLRLLSLDFLPIWSPETPQGVDPIQELRDKKLTVFDLVRTNDVRITFTSQSEICLEYEGAGNYYQEIMRADFNNDGLEEILAFYHYYSTTGTIKFSGCALLKRKDETSLIER